MKVKDLIEELKTFPREAEILLSSDGEGNAYYKYWDIEMDSNFFVMIYPSGCGYDYDELFEEN